MDSVFANLLCTEICNLKINTCGTFEVIHICAQSGEKFVTGCIHSQLRSNKVGLCLVSALT